MEKLDSLVCQLYDIGAVKFGHFQLKSGMESPIYFDLRVIVSYPHLMSDVSGLLWSRVEQSGSTIASVCGVPYTALPLATLMAVEQNLPMLMRRKETKDYGTKVWTNT